MISPLESDLGQALDAALAEGLHRHRFEPVQHREGQPVERSQVCLELALRVAVDASEVEELDDGICCTGSCWEGRPKTRPPCRCSRPSIRWSVEDRARTP